MSLLGKLADALTADDGEPRKYQCLNCGRTFRAATPPDDATCPDCGTNRVRTASE